jgi:hypothetical protein
MRYTVGIKDLRQVPALNADLLKVFLASLEKSTIGGVDFYASDHG